MSETGAQHKAKMTLAHFQCVGYDHCSLNILFYINNGIEENYHTRVSYDGDS